jgi:intracellular sulfur oxidation DsrE/DsrF family protein
MLPPTGGGLIEGVHAMDKYGKRSIHAAWLAPIVGALMLLAGYASARAADTLGDPAYKVVIQVSTSDPVTQRTALNNAANLRKALGMDNVKVEVVAYGPGLSLLTAKSKYPDRVPSMAAEGIRFSACHNTMEAIKRKTGHMPTLLKGVEVVPSGVARVVELEKKGYQYVRP